MKFILLVALLSGLVNTVVVALMFFQMSMGGIPFEPNVVTARIEFGFAAIQSVFLLVVIFLLPRLLRRNNYDKT